MRRFFEEQVWSEERPATRFAASVRALSRLPEALYAASVRLRNIAYDRGLLRSARAPLPIVSIGGIEVGGVGKTPLAIELARLAVQAGIRPAILTRGYGRRAEGEGEAARRVCPAAAWSDWSLHGDEPVLLAESTEADVWVARRRYHAAREAVKHGATIGILDDGFQHRVLSRDLDIVCLDARRPFGNGRLLPAGSLREDPRRALRRADRIVLTDDGSPDACAASSASLRGFLGADTPILSWHGEHSLHGLTGDPPLSGEPVLVVAGIARPLRAVGVLTEMGHPLAGKAFFPDHHPFSARDVELILAARPDPATPVVTTEKDWIRLRGAVAGFGGRWAVLRRRLVWNEAGAEAAWIRDLRGLPV